MAGLYPTDEVINMFGTDVNYPGLDPVTHKFTDGDFSDPLTKPSYIPAKTFNLILDNLGSLISGLGYEPNNTDPDQLIKAIQNYLFPVGSSYIQHVNDPSPLERGLRGTWEIWNARADLYGLRSEALPNYSTYTTGTNYSVGSNVLYHLPGDDYAIFKANQAITNAPQQLDPVKWDKLTQEIFVERRHLQEWLDNDFSIGTQIINGNYSGYYVSEIIVPGGKYFAPAGGNRPPFGEGTAPDFARPIKGKFGYSDNNGGLGVFPRYDMDGVFDGERNLGTPARQAGVTSAGFASIVSLDTSRTMLTGNENSPRTISILYWRYVA